MMRQAERIRPSGTVVLLFSLFICAGLEARAGEPDLPLAEIARTAPAGTTHLSNLSLVQGVGQKRKASPRPYEALVQIKTRRGEGPREEAFLKLLLTSAGFAGIFIAILTLRSLPPRRPG